MCMGYPPNFEVYLFHGVQVVSLPYNQTRSKVGMKTIVLQDVLYLI